MNPKRVLLIGLDGMTYDVMRPLTEAGVMPTCKRLMDEGSWGELTSTIPPVTGPAWCSFVTGKQPGNHGIFDFFKPTKSNNAVGMSRRLVNSKEVDGKTIWHFLSERDMKCIVMNVPVTYPPRPLNGVMFTGMLTPSVDGNLTYPPGLYQKLKPELGDYTITVNWQAYNESTAEQFVAALIACCTRRTDYCLRLMDEVPDWNLCFPCFTETDRIQHALWHYIDPAEREKTKAKGIYRQEVMDAVHAFYRTIDAQIARVMEKAGDTDIPIYFVSDHGFGRLDGRVYINEFLSRKGLLAFNPWKIRKAMLGLLVTKAFYKGLKTIGLQKTYNRMKAKKAADRSSTSSRTFFDVFYEAIDWTKTKVYMGSNTEGGLYINVKGRTMYGADVDRGIVEREDYEKVRQEVMEALKDVVDPDTGESMLSHVLPREEVYHGKYIERAPDIVFFLRDGEWIADSSLGKGLYKKRDWKSGSGMHRMEGCFLAHGPGITHNPNVTTNIFDVVPTILAYMGFAIPSDMDGKFIAEAFTDEWKSSHEITYGGDSDEAGKGWGEGADVFDDDDEQVLVDRLRGLGYIE